MKIGDKGVRLIQAFETCELVAYRPTADDVPTIGWGHTRGVAMGDTCSQDKADRWFLEDIAWVEECVNRAVTVGLMQNEFDALCSLCFNIGCNAFSGSTLVKMLNQSDYDGASAQFGVWNKQNHKVLAGLTRRREAERQLFEENAA